MPFAHCIGLAVLAFVAIVRLSSKICRLALSLSFLLPFLSPCSFSLFLLPSLALRASLFPSPSLSPHLFPVLARASVRPLLLDSRLRLRRATSALRCNCQAARKSHPGNRLGGGLRGPQTRLRDLDMWRRVLQISWTRSNSIEFAGLELGSASSICGVEFSKFPGRDQTL